jgi:hypothetical protein
VVRPPYPVVARLYALAAEHWILIDASTPATDLLRLPVRRFCNYVYAWLLERTKPEDRERLVYELNRPLPGQEKEVTPDMVEHEDAAFDAFMGLASGHGDV